MDGQANLLQFSTLYDPALRERDGPSARYAPTEFPTDSLVPALEVNDKGDLRTMYILQAEATPAESLSEGQGQFPAPAENHYHAVVPQPYNNIATGHHPWHAQEAYAGLGASAPVYWDSEASRIAARDAITRRPEQAPLYKTPSRRQKSKRILRPFGKKLKPSIRVDTSVSRHHGELPQQLSTGPLASGEQPHLATNSGLHLRAKTMGVHAPQRRDRYRAPAMPSIEEPILRETSGFSHSQEQQEARDVITDQSWETNDLGTATPTTLSGPVRVTSEWFLSPELEHQLHRPRAASSVYSRPAPHLPEPHQGPIAPVPGVPTPVSRPHAGFRDSSVTGLEENSETRRRDRVLSNVTVFEEDESPESARRGRMQNLNDLTIETALPTPRRSRGWWNVITTPFELNHLSVKYMRTPTSDGENTPNLPSHPQEATFRPQQRTDLGAEHQREVSPLSPDCETARPTPLVRTFPVDQALAEHPRQIEEQSPAYHNGNERTNFTSAGESQHCPPGQVYAPESFRSSQAILLRMEHSPLRSADTEVPIVLNVDLEHNAFQLQDDTGNTQQGPSAANGRSIPLPTRDASMAGGGALLPDDRVAQPSPMIIGLPAGPSRGLVILPQHARSLSSDRPTTKPEGIPAPPAYTQHPIRAPGTGFAGGDQIRRGTTRPKPSPYGSVHEKKSFSDGHSQRRGWFGCTKCLDGRSSRRHRSKRCWFLSCLCILLFAIVALVVALAVTLTRKHRGTHRDAPVQSAWLNLTGFPPIPTGVLTVARPDVIKANSGCVQPNTMWSCAVLKEQQQSIAPNGPDQPNFKLEIRFDNNTASKTSPSPAPPGLEDQRFLGNTTDNTTAPFEGERTPLSISFLSSTPLPSRIVKRNTSLNNTNGPFPDISVLIPPPDVSSDGTAAAASLFPLPNAQPLRFYNRGLPTEHYGFYTYYDRSILLKSVAPLNDSTVTLGDIPADENGGSTLEGASVRCTWAQTRFLVQIWTNKAKTAELLPPLSTASTSTSALPTTVTSSASSSSSNVFMRPGTFPYPVTITLDRHGGDLAKKLIYCYGMDNRGRIIPSAKKIQLEDRSFGGALVNPTDGPFGNVTVSIENGGPGGIDGGSGGCQCQWANWQSKK